jgi:hypothetical protein
MITSAIASGAPMVLRILRIIVVAPSFVWV